MKIWKVDNYCGSTSEDMEEVLNTYEKQGAAIKQIITHTNDSGDNWLNFSVVYTVEDDTRNYGI